MSANLDKVKNIFKEADTLVGKYQQDYLNGKVNEFVNKELLSIFVKVISDLPDTSPVKETLSRTLYFKLVKLVRGNPENRSWVIEAGFPGKRQQELVDRINEICSTTSSSQVTAVQSHEKQKEQAVQAGIQAPKQDLPPQKGEEVAKVSQAAIEALPMQSAVHKENLMIKEMSSVQLNESKDENELNNDDSSNTDFQIDKYKMSHELVVRAYDAGQFQESLRLASQLTPLPVRLHLLDRIIRDIVDTFSNDIDSQIPRFKAWIKQIPEHQSEINELFACKMYIIKRSDLVRRFFPLSDQDLQLVRNATEQLLKEDYEAGILAAHDIKSPVCKFKALNPIAYCLVKDQKSQIDRIRSCILCADFSTNFKILLTMHLVGLGHSCDIDAYIATQQRQLLHAPRGTTSTKEGVVSPSSTSVSDEYDNTSFEEYDNLKQVIFTLCKTKQYQESLAIASQIESATVRLKLLDELVGTIIDDLDGLNVEVDFNKLIESVSEHQQEIRELFAWHLNVINQRDLALQIYKFSEYEAVLFEQYKIHLNDRDYQKSIETIDQMQSPVYRYKSLDLLASHLALNGFLPKEAACFKPQKAVKSRVDLAMLFAINSALKQPVEPGVPEKGELQRSSTPGVAMPVGKGKGKEKEGTIPKELYDKELYDKELYDKELYDFVSTLTGDPFDDPLKIIPYLKALIRQKQYYKSIQLIRLIARDSDTQTNALILSDWLCGLVAMVITEYQESTKIIEILKECIKQADYDRDTITKLFGRELIEEGRNDLYQLLFPSSQ